jgi:VWFA-related protein
MQRFAAVLAVVFALVLPGVAQHPLPSSPAPVAPLPPTLNSRADDFITMAAEVTDHGGKPVPGLAQQDFKLLDNRRPVALSAFEAIPVAGKPNPPVQVVLLVDDVNASFSTIAFVKGQLQTFFARSGAQLPYPMSVDWLTDSGVQLQSAPTTDAKKLAAYVDHKAAQLHTIARGAGFYGAQERYQASLNALGQLTAQLSTQPGRKIVIWMSRGWDFFAGPRIYLTNGQEEEIFHSIIALSDGVRRADITLYSVDPLGAADAGNIHFNYYREFLQGVKKPNQAQLADLSLQVVSAQSGGHMCWAGHDLADQVQNCMNEAQAYYVFRFRPQPNEEDSPYHALTLQVDKPGLTIRTRMGYYSVP